MLYNAVLKMVINTRMEISKQLQFETTKQTIKQKDLTKTMALLRKYELNKDCFKNLSYNNIQKT